MKLYIPLCGDAIMLDSDWKFNLHLERRNSKFYELLTGQKYNWNMNPGHSINVTLNAGTELVFDRIYIHQQADEFASVTFVIMANKDIDMIGHRFWAKLSDVNTIDYHYLLSDNPVGVSNGYKKAYLASPDFCVKAAGGIRALQDALAMLEAGANRIGTSASNAILRALPA